MSKNFTFPDVSFYQDDPTTPLGIDFAKMRGQTSAVIIRAGQNVWIDNEFKISWENAKKAGMNRGSYWFYDSRAHPKRQAELWVDTLEFDTGELPLCCDFEDNYGGQYHGYRFWYDFMARLKELLPHKELMIYTGYYYWIENTNNMPESFQKFFGKHSLWVAWYNYPRPPLVPPPFKSWTFWQYTDNGDGVPYGVESKNIDLNFYNGTEQEFNQRFGFSDKPVQSSKIIAKYGNTNVEYERIIK